LGKIFKVTIEVKEMQKVDAAEAEKGQGVPARRKSLTD